MEMIKTLSQDSLFGTATGSHLITSLRSDSFSGKNRAMTKLRSDKDIIEQKDPNLQEFDIQIDDLLFEEVDGKMEGGEDSGVVDIQTEGGVVTRSISISAAELANLPPAEKSISMVSL